MRVISTVHKPGFDVCGQRWVEGARNWPSGTEFILYTEGFTLEDSVIEGRRIEYVARAEEFKRKYAHYRPVLWQWNIVGFGNKVFAAHDALYDYKGIAVWLDADAITYKPLPAGYVEAMLPQGAYMAMFKRQGMQTETGFWVMDCSHPEHKRFLDMWIKWLESGQFKTLNQWCDASTLDATVRIFEKHDAIQTVSLSGAFERDMHPMAKTDIARYIDHLKGSRKDLPASPENIFRNAA